MRRVLPGPCPVCSNEIQYEYKTDNIPYFSEILIMSARCSCGYRFVDVMVLGEQEPVRYILEVSHLEDLTARVIRSSTGTIQIPELEIKVEPGPICEAFITNVEGVLVRIENVVRGVLTWAEGGERQKAEDLLDRIAGCKSGSMPFTLIIEDPDGNSAIISPHALREPYELQDDE